MRLLILIGCAAVLAAAPATESFAADNPARQPEVIRLDDTSISDLYAGDSMFLATTCDVGNLNPGAWLINNFVLAPEAYAVTFDPAAQCLQCPAGFQVTTVHILMGFTQPCALVMGANLTELAPTGTPGCEGPAAELCSGALYSVNIPAAGNYNIALPVTCACAFTSPYKYALEVYFDSYGCTQSVVPRLITDNFPSLCTSWNNYGTGWIDLRAAYGTWPGNLNIYAQTTCCENPVPGGSESWGAIKSLYGTKD